MFCRLCGNKNVDSNFYCTNCGSSIKNDNMIKILNIQEEKKSFCEKCGIKVNSRYCVNCGNSVYSLKINQGSSFNINTGNIKSITSTMEKRFKTSNANIDRVKDLKNVISNSSLIKSSAIAAVKMLAIGIVISFVFFMVFTSINEVKYLLGDIKDFQQDMQHQMGVKTIKVVPNALDLYGLSFQNSFNLNARGRMFDQDLGKLKIVTNIKFLILLIIPIISIILAQIKVFKDKSSTKSHMMRYMTSSVLLSIILNGILFFNSKKIIISQGTNNFIKVSGNFNLIMSFIQVFIVAFVFQTLMSILFKKEKESDIINHEYNECLAGLHTYAKNMFFYALFYCITVFGYIMFLDGDAEEKLIIMINYILLLPNLIINIWLFIFGGKLSINFAPVGYQATSYLDDELPRMLKGFFENISLSNIWSITSKVRDFSGAELTNFVFFYVFIMLIVVAIVFILLESVKRLSNDKYFVKLAILAGGVSLTNYILAILSRNEIKVSGNSEIIQQIGFDFFSNQLSIGFSLAHLVMFTFAFVFIIGTIYYFVKKQSFYLKLNDFLENKKTVIKIGYLVLTLIVMFMLKEKFNDNSYFYNIF